MNANMQIANTIRDQIGHKALYMLGAKNFLAHEDGALSFRIRGSRKVNYIKVSLTSDDLYTMEFGKIHGYNYKVVNEVKGIFFDMMRPLIEDNTGLYTSL